MWESMLTVLGFPCCSQLGRVELGKLVDDQEEEALVALGRPLDSDHGS